MDNQIAQIVGNSVLESLKEEEHKVDQEINRLNNLDDEDLERIRENRLRKMKARFEKEKVWRSKGHGSVSEIHDQKHFFQTTKESKDVVILFYTPTNAYTEIVDKHLQTLAGQHLETKFCKMNAEKAEFLVNKLNIWMIPSLVLCQHREVIHVISGFDELGGTEKFSSTFLAYILSQYNILKYEGSAPESVTEEPDEGMKMNIKHKSNVRQSVFYDSDLEE